MLRQPAEEARVLADISYSHEAKGSDEERTRNNAGICDRFNSGIGFRATSFKASAKRR
jgi:hypothetical protein